MFRLILGLQVTEGQTIKTTEEDQLPHSWIIKPQEGTGATPLSIQSSAFHAFVVSLFFSDEL